MQSLHFENSVLERCKNDHQNGKNFEKSFSKTCMRSANGIYFFLAPSLSSHRNGFWSIKEIYVYSLVTFTMLSLLLKFEYVF